MENRQSCGEINRYRTSPLIKKILTDYAKKEEEKLVVPDKKTNKKDSEPKTPSKTEKASDKGSEEGTARTNESNEALKAEEEQKHAEFMKSLERLRKENFNMVLYGIPDVYMAN